MLPERFGGAAVPKMPLGGRLASQNSPKNALLGPSQGAKKRARLAPMLPAGPSNREKLVRPVTGFGRHTLAANV